MIAAEYEATQLYMQLAESTDNKLAIEVLKDIADEERVHAGEFLRLLRVLAPDEEKFYAKGAEEVGEEIESIPLRGTVQLRIGYIGKIGLDTRYHRGYTSGMKTAISLPKDVFEKAERLALKARKSRSQIYCEALREYVARHSPDDVTDALNRAMEQIGQTEDKFVTLASARALARAEW